MAEVEKVKQKCTKGLSFLLVGLVLMMSFVVQPFTAQAEDSIDLDAESAILVDAETGKVLYAKNPDVALPPASMTKMMTEYLVLEAIDNGDIDWDTKTEISDYPYGISADPSFSGVGLTQNKEYTVRELYTAMATFSDNGTTVALAELIADSESDFVKLMNKKGEEMGLPEYKFVNSSGLENANLGDDYPEGTDPDGSNLLSARSAALLGYHLVNDYPEALDFSSEIEVEFEDKKVENLNWMLKHKASNYKPYYYEGMDGLKTGNTDLAGYCFTGTAERDGTRLISVVMKTDSEDERFKETAKLMDYGFSKFKTEELFPAGYKVKDESEIPVSKGKDKTVDASLKEAVTIPIKEDEKDLYSIKYAIDKDKLNADGELQAPIKKGTKIGTAEVIYDGGDDQGYIFPDKASSVDLITDNAVDKANWFMLTLGAIGGFFSDLFTTAVDWVKGLF